MLLLQDRALPSVAAAIAGEPIKGSWWSHPRSREIFACLQVLDDDASVTVTRLVGGKVTYLDAALRDAFLVVARSGEPWQTRGLSSAARALLRKVQRGDVSATGAAARELQQRLLVDAVEVHTESGKHEVRLRMWKEPARESDVGDARAMLEQAVVAIGGRLSLLPWLTTAR